MGTSHLWVIDRDGRVFLFTVRDKSWRQISTPELGSRNCFKRVSAVEQCAWAISANQQPYVFVHATELPIRVKVETYENQRWGIVNGWSTKSVRCYFCADRHVNYQSLMATVKRSLCAYFDGFKQVSFVMNASGYIYNPDIYTCFFVL